MEADLIGFLLTCLYYIFEPITTSIWVLTHKKEEDIFEKSFEEEKEFNEIQTPEFLKAGRRWFDYGIDVDITSMNEDEILKIKTYIRNTFSNYAIRRKVAQKLHNIDPEERILDTVVFVRYISQINNEVKYEQFSE